jgi:hypothetical protein
MELRPGGQRAGWGRGRAGQLAWARLGPGAWRRAHCPYAVAGTGRSAIMAPQEPCPIECRDSLLMLR